MQKSSMPAQVQVLQFCNLSAVLNPYSPWLLSPTNLFSISEMLSFQNIIQMELSTVSPFGIACFHSAWFSEEPSECWQVSVGAFSTYRVVFVLQWMHHGSVFNIRLWKDIWAISCSWLFKYSFHEQLCTVFCVSICFRLLSFNLIFTSINWSFQHTQQLRRFSLQVIPLIENGQPGNDSATCLILLALAQSDVECGFGSWII